ncbi:MAG: hypothetical protein JWN86_1684 [Planctomycetota bacterium]|nr:hypothetical protein [Planctomycetota bacterium]
MLEVAIGPGTPIRHFPQPPVTFDDDDRHQETIMTTSDNTAPPDRSGTVPAALLARAGTGPDHVGDPDPSGSEAANTTTRDKPRVSTHLPNLAQASVRATGPAADSATPIQRKLPAKIIAARAATKAKAGTNKPFGGEASNLVTKDSKCDKLVDEIRQEQQQLHCLEGEAVLKLTAIGSKLIELKVHAARTWTDRVASLGHSPRVASRLMSLGKAWDGEIGRIASDLRARLPHDVNKLEWICRIPLNRMEKILAGKDCRALGRPQIVAAVKAALGLVAQARPKSASPGGIAKSFTRSVDKVVCAIRGTEMADVDRIGIREDLRGILDRALAGLEPEAESPVD